MTAGARLIVLGRQGAGKGTQADRLSQHFEVPHISSGDVLREAVRSGSELGRNAQRFMVTGDLVPDSLVIDMIAERLRAPDAAGRGFVLDGFPRTRSQAEALFDLLPPAGIDTAVDIAVPTDLVVLRLAARRVCPSCNTMAVAAAGEAEVTCTSCGDRAVLRVDDHEDAIARRLELYHAETHPLLEWLTGRELLVTVDGVGTPDEVAARMLAAVQPTITPRMAETA